MASRKWCNRVLEARDPETDEIQPSDRACRERATHHSACRSSDWLAIQQAPAFDAALRFPEGGKTHFLYSHRHRARAGRLTDMHMASEQFSQEN
ncbi:hypothetical protein C0Q70_11936 [Pomacea canaliculata]|uniref:Uncharacterized protein n=1 Tax=Pomacea canaliculata TaxID=400727 RepID=A0A2T7P7D6_POMCA|nr:hypothetical protein C0Q70_11936 [Pomacea canaliculata]